MTTPLSTPLSRRIVIHGTEELAEMRTAQHGYVPLTNPGVFKPGIYRGDIDPDALTATLTWIGELP